MKAFLIHFNFEFKSGVRKKQQFFLTYLFPLGFYAMMGLLMPELNPHFLDTMLPAMLIFCIMAAAFLAIPDSLVSAREQGIFRGFRTGGIPAGAILLIPALTTLVHLFVTGLMVGLTAGPLFDARQPGNIAGTAAAFLLTAFSCTGFSLLLGTVSTNSRSTMLWSQLLFIPSMLIGGLMIPYDMLPAAVRPAALALPATHGMNLFAVWGYGDAETVAAGLSALYLLGTGLLGILVSRIFFRWSGSR